MNTHRIHPEIVEAIERVVRTSKISDNNVGEVMHLAVLLTKHLYEGESK